MPKRLAKPVESAESEVTTPKEIMVTDYTERSFVVTGDTIPHSENLKRLGGSFNPNLGIGAGWIFSKARKESVENYIKTGEVKPYVFDKSKFDTSNPDKINKIFSMLNKAFESDAEYEGAEVLEVIRQIKEKI